MFLFNYGRPQATDPETTKLKFRLKMNAEYGQVKSQVAVKPRHKRYGVEQENGRPQKRRKKNT